MTVSKEKFGTLKDGTIIYAFTLTNDNGMLVEVLSYGGVIRRLKMPDKDGSIEDIVLGFSSLQSYEDSQFYLGGIVGRYANRMEKGKFSLNHQTYQLTQNNGGHHLHGGTVGLDKVVWKIHHFKKESSLGLRLIHLSPDQTEGYPGNLDIEITYLLTQDNKFEITYKATTDKKTIINLTNHASFNLTGNVKDTILNHDLFINADYFLPTNKQQIPIGQITEVHDTSFDFRKVHPIGKRLNIPHKQIDIAQGFDHSFVLNRAVSIHLAALLADPLSGRKLKVYTTEPILHLYSGNYVGSIMGKDKILYKKHDCVCLEAQHCANAPNLPRFPSTVLDVGEVFQSKTVWEFSWT